MSVLSKFAEWRKAREWRRAELHWHNSNPSQFTPIDDAWVLRRLKDDAFNTQLGDVGNTGAAPWRRIAVEREMRRRDAWAAPAGRAYWISLGALLVAIASLLVSALRFQSQPPGLVKSEPSQTRPVAAMVHPPIEVGRPTPPKMGRSQTKPTKMN